MKCEILGGIDFRIFFHIDESDDSSICKQQNADAFRSKVHVYFSRWMGMPRFTQVNANSSKILYTNILAAKMMMGKHEQFS